MTCVISPNLSAGTLRPRGFGELYTGQKCTSKCQYVSKLCELTLMTAVVSNVEGNAHYLPSASCYPVGLIMAPLSLNIGASSLLDVHTLRDALLFEISKTQD